MYSAEAKSLANEQVPEPAKQRPRSDRWETFPPSWLSHHGGACCELAREWVIAMDFAQLGGADRASGPRWLRQKYKWGPSPWPMHWCEVVKRDTIDCGAHSALAHAAFTARGLTALPVQLVQSYSLDAADQWRGSWQAEGVSCHWLDGDHIYHEATGLLTGTDELRIWDGSAGSWVNPRQGSGYGSLVALRVFSDGEGGPLELGWGEQRVQVNSWNQLRR